MRSRTPRRSSWWTCGRPGAVHVARSPRHWRPSAAVFAGRVKVVKVNVDESPAIAQRYQARSIPMLLIMDGGRVVDTMIGAQPTPMVRSRISGALDRRG